MTITNLPDFTSSPQSPVLPSSTPDTQPSNLKENAQKQDLTLDCDDVPPSTCGNLDVGDQDHEMLQVDVTTGPKEGWSTVGSRVHKALEGESKSL